MINYIIKFLINLIDYNNKKKIINFFKSKFSNKKKLKIIDVGAHHGETAKLLLNHFDIDKIYCFEPSYENFKILEKNFLKLSHVKLYNYGLANKEGKFDFFQTSESSSSTFVKINKNSKYYKKKYLILNLGLKKNYINTKCDIKKGIDFFIDNKINDVDLLKIDTEGFEYEVLDGIGKELNKVKFIYFEHHFDDMLKKSYTLTNIHKLLVNNNFEKVFKLKMNFRKAFEYIYMYKENKK